MKRPNKHLELLRMIADKEILTKVGLGPAERAAFQLILDYVDFLESAVNSLESDFDKIADMLPCDISELLSEGEE